MPLWPPASSGGGYDTIQNAGAPLTKRTTVNFTGAGVSATDAGGISVVNIPGGSGDVAMSKLAPTSNVTILAGYGAYVPDHYEIVLGVSLELALGSCFEIG